MAFQKKYWFEYKSLKVGSTTTYKVELWQNTEEVLVEEEIKGGQSPFILEMPDIDDKFKVIRGRGCTLTLLSDTDMKFFAGLKHIDPKEFKIIHYIDGVKDWVGYLNADMQSEPYDIDFNYLITTTGTDGFSLMDRYKFLQSDESKYFGVKTKYELLQICLDKIGLEFTDIRIKLATTFAEFSGDADSTILHESVLNCANFYDEDGKAMTLREVVESILAPYGAFIIQSNGSIYITDIHTMGVGGSISFKKFNSSTYAYISDVSITVEKDINDIGYFGTGHSIERSGGTNIQKVVYSPYPHKNVIPETIITPNEFTTVPASYSSKDGYYYKTLVGHTTWQNVPMTLSTFEESGASNLSAGNKNVYFRYPGSGLGVKVLELINKTENYLSVSGASLSNVISISGRRNGRYLDGVALLIEAEVLTKTKDNPYATAYTPTEIANKADKVEELYINYKCKIGDWYYNGGSWAKVQTEENYIRTNAESGYIGNSFVSIGRNGGGELIKIGNLDEEIVLNGFFEFEIWSDTKIRIEGGELIENSSVLQEVWIKKLQIRLVNFDGSEIEDSDIEYIGQLDKLLSQEGKDINLKVGSQIGFADRAKILAPNGTGDYVFLNAWTRNGQTFRIEELLLNSLCSNYRMNYITLSGMKLKNEFSVMNVLTDTTFLTGSKFMVKNSSIDYANYTHDVTLVEIFEDELTIVKE